MTNSIAQVLLEMTSKELAEVTGKQHKNVIRDIKNEIAEIGKEKGQLIFEPTSYIDKSNRKKPLYKFGKKGAMQLALKYDAVTRFKVIERIEELENKQTTPSYTIDDPIKRAEKWIEEQKEMKQLETSNKMLNQQVSELKPKADYTDKILKNKGTVTIGQIAKDYGLSAQSLNKKLHELGVQYKQSGQWLLYSQFHGKGYTHSKTVEITKKDGSKDIRMNTKWTTKGRLFLYESLKENKIIPMIEKDDES